MLREARVVSVRLEVMSRVKTALNAVGRPSGLPEARVRRPMPVNQQTAPTGPEMNLYFVRELGRAATNKSGPLTKKHLTLVVESRSPTKDPEEVDSILEPFHSWAEKVLSGETLGGYVHLVSFEGIDWVPVYADRVYAVSLTRFLVEYQTKRDDPDEVQ